MVVRGHTVHLILLLPWGDWVSPHSTTSRKCFQRSILFRGLPGKKLDLLCYSKAGSTGCIGARPPVHCFEWQELRFL